MWGKKKFDLFVPGTPFFPPRSSTFSHVASPSTELSRCAILFVELVHKNVSFLSPWTWNIIAHCSSSRVTNYLVQHCDVAKSPVALHVFIQYCQVSIWTSRVFFALFHKGQSSTLRLWPYHVLYRYKIRAYIIIYDHNNAGLFTFDLRQKFNDVTSRLLPSLIFSYYLRRICSCTEQRQLHEVRESLNTVTFSDKATLRKT